MEKSIDTFKQDLGKRIRELRIKENLTQSELALKIGFKDKQIVNSYELNGANPTAYNLMMIAKALNVSFNELLNFKN